MLSRGDKVLVLESGRFAIGWGEAAQMLGAGVEILPGDFRRAVKPEAVEARLKADARGEIKAILVAQIDTASGVINDIKAIGEAVRAAGHDALLMVDAVASLGCVPFEMDAWGVDVAMAGSQKGLMTPPGLGFTAAGPRAKEAHKTADLRSPYWDWTLREGEQHYQKYAGTPPEHLLVRAARRARSHFRRGTRERVPPSPAARRGDAPRGRHLGRGAGDRLQRAEAGGALRHGTAVVTRGGESAQPLVDYCREKCGVVLGRALGKSEGKGFRIAHMGHVNAPMILGTLSVVEMGLSALGLPHGKGGVQAAVDYLAKSVPA